MEAILKNIYYSSKGYGGVRKLYKAGKKLWPKLTLKQTKHWLQSQPTYTIHAAQNRKPIRRKYWAPAPMVMIEADLGFMRGASSNFNRPGFLLCIDVFSRSDLSLSKLRRIHTYLGISLPKASRQKKRRQLQSWWRRFSMITASQRSNHFDRIKEESSSQKR